MKRTKLGFVLSATAAIALSLLPMPAQAEQVCISLGNGSSRVTCGQRVDRRSRRNNRRYRHNNRRYNTRLNRRGSNQIQIRLGTGVRGGRDKRYYTPYYGRDRYNQTYQNRLVVPASFNERFYLLTNPDVNQAVRQGKIRNGYSHYQEHGRFEGRNPSFNESSYLLNNPDVVEGVRRGHFRNGYDHWLRYGRKENRKL